MGCLTAAGLLLLRAWDVWFVNDRFIWPFVIAAAGGALIWRQSQTAPGAGGAAGAAPAPDRQPGRPRARRWSSAAR